ncbi:MULTISPECIES: DNA-formamidopyrimidine glycosylase [unclassified Streptococcus]|uniref:DNA-formamidopyrimidine glycosylase n=1 Tax=unclassified Streptococcus TaxID=2608887 RepID=UPI0010719E26|nr:MULTISPECIES: DNA-formamidopyrimidine glycosylase [unclassified Streptococcus]MBF0806540.1 DNA-formamidopyrimidine glycosylase [Streptococcus sp. 19428wA2_WM07]TFU27590.1 DNA-formamidopyrimidine glycosylase [Streptococcus sp. WM07]
MPELPEVETVRRGLSPLLKGKVIAQVTVLYSPMVRTGAETLVHDLLGQEIQDVQRRGKYLIFDLGKHVLLSHLRMEGKFFFQEEPQKPLKHQHVLIDFEDGSRLVYQDVRKFGTLDYLEKDALEAYFKSKKLGPEPVEEAFRLKEFREGLEKSRKPVKSLLLEQRLVAGLGNIYVDEVLWQARIHPLRQASSLSARKITQLRKAIIEVLAEGVARGGSTIRTYKNVLGQAGTMQEVLKVYGQEGQPCPRCGQAIEKFKVGGRGTHICPRCQKL